MSTSHEILSVYTHVLPKYTPHIYMGEKMGIICKIKEKVEQWNTNPAGHLFIIDEIQITPAGFVVLRSLMLLNIDGTGGGGEHQPLHGACFCT